MWAECVPGAGQGQSAACTSHLSCQGARCRAVWGPIWEKRGQTGDTCPLIWTRKETTKSHRSPPAGAHLDGLRDEQEALTRAAQA